MPFKVRGRILIVVPFSDGSYVKIETLKHLSLTAEQVRDDLRKHADTIDRALSTTKKADVP